MVPMFILCAMENVGKASEGEGRNYCYRCMRAVPMCLCSLLPGRDTKTEIHILQHDRERRHAFGTVRLLKIGLTNTKVYPMRPSGGQKQAMPKDFPLDAGVLYPGPGSLDLETLAPSDRPSKLVVIDGTWSQAHCMYRDNPWLQGLTRYSLNPAQPSRYRIRLEPSAECLSTLESTVMALRLLEPENDGVLDLLRAFDRMNDLQIDCMAKNNSAARRIKRPRDREMRAVPEALWSDPSRLVIVYGESAKPAVRRDKKTREVAQWSALRWQHPQKSFDCIVKTEVPMPCERFLGDLGWKSADVDQARPFAELAEKWRDFLRPDDIVVAWNKGTLRLAMRHGLVSEGLLLKEIYGNISKGPFGTLDEVVAAEGLRPLPVPSVVGRGASRLGNAHAVVGYLLKWAQAAMKEKL